MSELQDRLIGALVGALTEADPLLEIGVGDGEIRIGWNTDE